MCFLILSGKLNGWMNMFDIQSPVISSFRFLFRHPTDDVFSQQLIFLLRQLKLVLKCLTILVLFDDDLLNKGNKNLVARHTTRYTKTLYPLRYHLLGHSTFGFLIKSSISCVLQDVLRNCGCWRSATAS